MPAFEPSSATLERYQHFGNVAFEGEPHSYRVTYTAGYQEAANIEEQWENGQLTTSTLTSEDGRRSIREYYPSGNMSSELCLDKDSKAQTKYFFEDKKPKIDRRGYEQQPITQTDQYTHSENVTQIISEDKSGHVIAQQFEVDGKKHGPSITYKDGKLIKFSVYNKGDLDVGLSQKAETARKLQEMKGFSRLFCSKGAIIDNTNDQVDFICTHLGLDSPGNLQSSPLGKLNTVHIRM